VAAFVVVNWRIYSLLGKLAKPFVWIGKKLQIGWWPVRHSSAQEAGRGVVADPERDRKGRHDSGR
jgi:hypothetical protein